MDIKTMDIIPIPNANNFVVGTINPIPQQKKKKSLPIILTQNQKKDQFDSRNSVQIQGSSEIANYRYVTTNQKMQSDITKPAMLHQRKSVPIAAAKNKSIKSTLQIQMKKQNMMKSNHNFSFNQIQNTSLNQHENSELTFYEMNNLKSNFINYQYQKEKDAKANDRKG